MMKRLILSILPVLAMTACTKMPINGDLDGMWQLYCIEKPDTSIYQKNIFWSFQLHLLQLGSIYHYYSQFENRGDTLRVYNIAIASPQEKATQNDEWVKEDDKKRINDLKLYGIFSLDTHFKVEELNEEHMRLRSDSACLHFRKY